MNLKKIKLLPIIFFIVLHGCFIFSYGQALPDSVKKTLDKKTDIEKIEFLNNLAEKNSKSSPEKSIMYANISLEISIKIKNRNGELNALLILGKALKISGKYSESIDNIQKAMNIYLTANRKEGIAYCYSETGSIYKELNQYNNALDDLSKALKLYQELKDNKNANLILNNIGNIYFKTQAYQKAIEYYKKSLELIEPSGNNKEVIIILNQLGASYANWGNYEEALKYLEKAKKIAETNNYTQLLSSISKNINDIQYNIANTEKVKTNFDKEKNIKQEQYVSSLETENLVVKHANLKSMEEIEKLSFENQAKELKLHIIQDRYDRQILINKMKEQGIKLLDAKNKLAKAELLKGKEKLKTQKIIIFIILAAFCIVLILLIFLFKLYLYKKKALILLGKQHQEILIQKEEIETQNDHIANINKELEHRNILITDSINYAKHIQDALMSDEKLFKKYLPESFILFKPKDVVSGDFFWFYKDDNKMFFAVVDCTGHGVSGAFMSMIGNTLLNKIIKEKKVKRPSQILKELNLDILNLPTQSSADFDSGMDITLCCFDQDKSELTIACANHFIFLVDNENILTIEGDSISIGEFHKNIETVEFQEKVIKIEEHTTIYLFSDGYIDQFGGPKNEKFMRKRFKNILLENSRLSMIEQYQVLETSFNNWKGNNLQIDDVLVMGIKF